VRGPEPSFPRLIALLFAVAFPCLSAQGADAPEQRLKSVEKQIEESRAKEAQSARAADALAAEIAALRSDSIAAARAAQEQEGALSALDEQLAALGAEEARKAAELMHHRAQQTQLLMALERLAQHPPEALALAPEDPLDAVRSARLMGAAVPPLEKAARALRQEIVALGSLRQQIADAQVSRRGKGLALKEEQTRLAALIDRKTALQRQAQHEVEESGQRQAQLATQASDLQQLIERLSAERQVREAEAQRREEEEARREEQRLATLAEPPTAPSDNGTVEVAAPAPLRLDPSKPRQLRPFAGARGHMIYPASGHLMLRYGENDEFGVASKGLTLETRAGAQVIAPFDGRVLFAGPFKGYGQILIIEHGDGYHSLLAGLDRVEGVVGQWVVAGEPVGLMAGGDTKPHLYLELRHDGQPINPLPWLATRDEKVSG
jgi:septal ring factor EnvC (AmiA/AmiB activator)